MEEYKSKTLVLNISLAGFMSLLFFGISDISRALTYIGIPRPVPYIIYIVTLVLFVFKNISRIKIYDLIYYLIVVIAVLYGIAANGSYIENVINIYAIILLFIPGYFYFRFVNDDDLVKGLRIAIDFSSIFLIVYYWLFVRTQSGYDMNYAYWIATPLCINLYYYRHKYFCILYHYTL